MQQRRGQQPYNKDLPSVTISNNKRKSPTTFYLSTTPKDSWSLLKIDTNVQTLLFYNTGQLCLLSLDMYIQNVSIMLTFLHQWTFWTEIVNRIYTCNFMHNMLQRAKTIVTKSSVLQYLKWVEEKFIDIKWKTNSRHLSKKFLVINFVKCTFSFNLANMLLSH